MSRTSVLILLGIFTILMPVSGLPLSVRTFFTMLFGGCVLSIGLTLRAREVRDRQQLPETPPAPPPPSQISPI